jgi:hypothetical protein
LRGEVAHLGIEATVVELGHFRTNILSKAQTESCYKKTIEDYAPLMTAVRGALEQMSGAESGDTDKVAQLIVEILTKTGRGEGKKLPARLPIGKEGFAMAQSAISEATKDLDEWESIVTADLEIDTP